MTSTATTVVGWSLILGVGGIAYWQYRSNNKTSKTSTRRASSQGLRTARPHGPATDRQRGGSRERRRKENIADVNEVDRPATRGPAAAEQQQQQQHPVKQRKKNKDGTAKGSSSAVQAAPSGQAVAAEKDTDDLAFAQQLASTQSGTTLRTPERHSQKVRTTKAKPSQQQSWPSSSAALPSEAEQEEDQTSSPPSESIAAAPAAAADISGVQDMLEARQPGPSTLRLIPSAKPQREPTPRPAKPAEQEETKKQRQRRKRREAEKAQAALDEAERRRLMEKQLKTARTLEGTAKSGQYRTYTPPSSNAWAPSQPAPAIAPVSNAALLDTFELDSSSTPTDEPQLVPSSSSGDGSRVSVDSEASSLLQDHERPEQPVIIADTSVPPAAAAAADASLGNGDASAWENYQIRTLESREKRNDGWTEVTVRGGKKKAAAGQ